MPEFLLCNYKLILLVVQLLLKSRLRTQLSSAHFIYASGTLLLLLSGQSLLLRKFNLISVGGGDERKV